MVIQFNASAERTLGVEIEMQIINPETYCLSPQAIEIIKLAKTYNVSGIKAEVHQSMLEINTEICRDISSCFSSLEKRCIELTDIVQKLNLCIATAGTHAFQNWRDRRIFPEKRYKELYARYHWLIRRMNVYGMHVHIGIQTKKDLIHLLNLFPCYFPHFIALSASSPYWGGTDTGFECSRVSIMESFPYAGIPPYFASWNDFEEYYKLLFMSGIISSFKDLYWFVRPNMEYGTIELRVCDSMPTLVETMAVVAFLQCLVEYMIEQPPVLSSFPSVIAVENQFRAQRDGVNAQIILDASGATCVLRDDLYALLAKLEPIAKKLNCSVELAFVAQIIEKGNSARRQRLIYEQTHSLKDVLSKQVDELRTNTPAW